jgi:hypothetical protein
MPEKAERIDRASLSHGCVGCTGGGLSASRQGAFLSGLFSTHPPIPDRIARLRNLGGIAVTASEMPAPQFPRDADAHPKGPWDTSAPPTHKGPWG